jgi:hypothetical protein
MITTEAEPRLARVEEEAFMAPIDYASGNLFTIG